MTSYDTIQARAAPQDVSPGDKIGRLLAGTYRDPDSGAPIGVETRSLVIGDSLAGREDELIAALGFGKRLAVVSDHTTHAVLGERVERALSGRHVITSVVLPEGTYPDEETVQSVRQA